MDHKNGDIRCSYMYWKCGQTDCEPQVGYVERRKVAKILKQAYVYIYKYIYYVPEIRGPWRTYKRKSIAGWPQE